MIEDEIVAIKQAQLDEIKLCVCFIKHIWQSFSLMQISPTSRKQSVLFIT
jgi:hypothetical protein